MSTLTKKVLEFVEAQPEGAPIAARGLLHLSNRAALDQTLSRLTRRGELMRVGRGVYVRPIKTKYGVRSPLPEKVVSELIARGETIISNGAAAANALGLTQQVPVKTIYLTSGPSRNLTLGKQSIELRHAKPWQLAKANERPGQVARALGWLGPEQADRALTTVQLQLTQKELSELQQLRSVLPEWMAQKVSNTLHANG